MAGYSVDEIIREYPTLTRAQIYAALHYVEQQPQEEEFICSVDTDIRAVKLGGGMILIMHPEMPAHIWDGNVMKILEREDTND